MKEFQPPGTIICFLFRSRRESIDFLIEDRGSISLQACGSAQFPLTNRYPSINRKARWSHQVSSCGEPCNKTLSILNAVERVATVPVLQFPLWLAFAAGPGETDDLDDLL